MSNGNKMKFTQEQNDIINADISNVLVSAAAGSGKTTVLVERIVQQIIKGTAGINQVLVLTFTNDAADNMIRKIECRIGEKIRECETEGDRDTAMRLREQLDLLPNAYIQTIDSFCSRVLKEKGYLVSTPEDMDVFASGNVILDESNLELILRRASDLAIADMYMNEQDEDSPFMRLTHRFGDGRTDGSLSDSVVASYKKLRSIPDYIGRIDKFVDCRRKKADSGSNPYIDRMTDEIIASFRISEPLIDDLEQYCYENDRYPLKKGKKKGMAANDEPIADAVNRVFSEVREYVSNAISVYDDTSASYHDKYEAIRNVDSLVRLFNESILGGLNSCKTLEDAEFGKYLGCLGDIMEPVKTLLPGGKLPSNYHKFPGEHSLPEDYKDVLVFPYDHHVRSWKDNTEVIAEFAEILKLCDGYYARLKSMMHGSDFADQEYGAYEVLKTPEASSFYRSRFSEIYIDEYQDNSELQDSIITRIAREDGDGNVFRVGDVKQSIYKFRSADPDMFLKHLDNLTSDPKKETGYLRLLTENHRSSRQILRFVNFVFEQIMTKEASEIEYDDSQHLNEAEETGDSPLPNIVVVNRASSFWDEQDRKPDEDEEPDEDDETPLDLSANQRISLCYGVLREALEYLKGKDHKEKDICVLTKTVSMSKSIADFLNANGVHAASEDRTRIFQDMNIQSVISMIILLGNELRDEYLMSVMLRNFRCTNFTLDDLASINAFFKKDPALKEFGKLNLMIRIRKYCEMAPDSGLKTRLQEFLDTFDDLRMTTRAGDIDEVTDMIYSVTGIMANAEAAGGFAKTKLILLKDWLSSKFKRYGTDISTVSSKLEEMKIRINTDARFDATDASDSAVRCMSIHKSKGLDFPCVILAFDDGKEGSDKDGNILFDKKMGFIANDYNEDDISLNLSSERLIYDNEHLLETNAESLRLLYVALTRAKEYLSVVTVSDIGTDKNKVTFFDNAVNNTKICKEKCFGRNHWIKGTRKIGYALISAIIRASAAEPLRNLLDHEEGPFGLLMDNDSFSVTILDTDGLREVAAATSARASDSEGAGDAAETAVLRNAGDYSDVKSTEIPFKVAVTGIEGPDISGTTHVDLRVRDKEEFLDRLTGKVTSRARGSIVHLIMQWADPERIRKGTDELISNVSELIDDGIFNKYLPEDVLAVARRYAPGIIFFAGSDVGRAMDLADQNGMAEFEKPIVFAVPAYEGASPDDFVLVQGMIDAIYHEPDGSVIIDYKTDNYGDIPEDEVRTKAVEAHRFQLDCYAASCEASGIRIKKKYLYLVRYQMLVEM
ncbi:MAG: UvrD-helicase domain-containing protein [Clostridiales bacterium]|nr:UvrD-helicase domain-containing protein [Clostridiales bacterium]